MMHECPFQSGFTHYTVGYMAYAGDWYVGVCMLNAKGTAFRGKLGMCYVTALMGVNL